MNVHLIDGTYELFRALLGGPPAPSDGKRGRRGARRCSRRCSRLLGERDVTHVAVAFDHVIESFRNDLYPATRPATGSTPRCSRSSGSPRTRCRALGVVVWPMIEFEADDALATAAAALRRRPRVEQVVDLHARQGPRAVRARRPRRAVRPAARASGSTRPACRAKFGVDARVDSRLARAGRRQRRRLSRACPAGARSRRPRCSAATSTSRTIPGRRRRCGRSPVRGARGARRDARARSATTRSCSAARDAAHRRARSRSRSTTGAGAARRPALAALAEHWGDDAIVERATRFARR